MNADDRTEVAAIARAEIRRHEERRRHQDQQCVIGFRNEHELTQPMEPHVLRAAMPAFCYQPLRLLMSPEARQAFSIVQIQFGRRDGELVAPVSARVLRDLTWLPVVLVGMDYVWTVLNRSDRPMPFSAALRVKVER